MQSAPVWAATRPFASTTPTWRTAASGSGTSTAASAAAAPSPFASRSSAFGPWAGSTTDWVATTPAPGRVDRGRLVARRHPRASRAPDRVDLVRPGRGASRAPDRVDLMRPGRGASRAPDRVDLVPPRHRAPRYSRDGSSRPSPRPRPEHPAGVRAHLRRRVTRRAALRRLGAVRVRRPARPVAPDRARRWLAREGRAPAPAAGGGGHPVPRRPRRHASGAAAAVAFGPHVASAPDPAAPAAARLPSRDPRGRGGGARAGRAAARTGPPAPAPHVGFADAERERLARRAARLRELVRPRGARGRRLLDPHGRGAGRHAGAHQGVGARPVADAARARRRLRAGHVAGRLPVRAPRRRRRALAAGDALRRGLAVLRLRFEARDQPNSVRAGARSP